jgi:hypothetical protein
MVDPGAEFHNPAPQRRLFPRSVVYGCVLLFLFFLFFGALDPANLGGLKHAWGSAGIQVSRQIALAMFQYANDNDQNYPDGKSSTEVFQKLLDGGYVTDPAIFYIPLPGKSVALTGKKLKPENVSWDVTCCLAANDSDLLPVVFMTGYKVNYVPGGAAVPLVKLYPRFGGQPRSWPQWWHGVPQPSEDLGPGIAVTYKTNSSLFKLPNLSVNSDGSIPNFISSDFKPNGKIYRQLTPDGPLP